MSAVAQLVSTAVRLLFSVESRGRARRRLLGLLTALVVFAPVAACTGATKSARPAEGKRQLVSMAEPAKGPVDQVVWNLTLGEPDTLDPSNAASYSGGQVVMNLCDTLVRYDADLNLTPGLATYEQVTPTKLVYTIRDNATFWDGKPVTAEDVAYSLNRAKNGSALDAYYDLVKSIGATGKHEVTVLFSKPDEKFNAEMTNIAGAIVEKAFAEKAGAKFGTAAGGLMCSGPFELGKWTPGDSVTIVRNNRYWDHKRIPLAEKVKFTFVTDTSALTQALDTGEIDGAYQIPPSAIPALKRSDAGRLYFGPSTELWALYIAGPGGPLADPKLRQALQHIIDRQALSDVVFRGASDPLYTFVTPFTWPRDQTERYKAAYDKFRQQRAFDLDAAKALVQDSKYKGEPLVLAYQSDDATQRQLAQVMQQQARAVGVEFKLMGMGALAYSAVSYDAKKRAGIDLLIGPTFNSIADPLEPLQFPLQPNGIFNYTDYKNSTATELLNRARSTFDSDQRAQTVIQLQDLYEDANILIPLVTTYTVTFLNNRLAGAVTSFAYWMTPNMAFIGSAK